MRRPSLDLSVYLVTDTTLCGLKGVPATVAAAARAGVTAVQLRDPAASDDELVALGRAVVVALRGTGVPLLVNDRVHLVDAIGADGAHIGQSDLDPVAAREVLGPRAYLGLSAQTLEHVAAARARGVGTLDYLGVGPVWPQVTKPDAAEPGGVERLREIGAASPWPCVAIGGIDVDARAGRARDRGRGGRRRQRHLRPAGRRRGRPCAAGRVGRGVLMDTRPVRRRRPPVALTIAGSDPSGGAGIQADLKTFSALGAYGTSVLVALTAQSTQGVTGVHVVPAEFVTRQLDTLAADVRIDAVKIGMLATAAVADAVAAFLERQACDVVVLDPVMVATSGDRLLADDAVEAVRRLLPLASVVTPNLAEAATLLQEPVATSVEEMVAQAHRLRAAGAARVLLKGGHLPGGDEAVDVLVGPDGVRLLAGPRIDTTNTHGTGCSLSSALAALRPQRRDWDETAQDAKTWLTGALAAADSLEIGQGHGPVHHFHELWSTP